MTAELASLYLATEISLALPGLGWERAANALERLSGPVFVITAWNPGSERPETAVNQERNRILYSRLVELGATVHPALGASMSGDHFEESYAVLGLDRENVLALGREFEQIAVFELTTSHQTVIASDGSWALGRAHVRGRSSSTAS